MHPAIGPPPAAATATSGRCRADGRRPDRAVAGTPRATASSRACVPADSWPAIGVQRQRAVERDPRRALHERAGFAVAAETQRFQPGEREKREAVVEFGDVDVRGVRSVRDHISAAASVDAIFGKSSRWNHPPEPYAPPIASTATGAVRAVRRVVGVRDHHRDRSVDRHVAVEQPERRRHRPRRQVVVHRHRIADRRQAGLRPALRLLLIASQPSCSLVVP